MKHLSIFLLLLCCACGTTNSPAPTAVFVDGGRPISGGQDLPLSVQSTLIAAEATRIHNDSAIATETRRLTQEAASDAQTATAFPISMEQTSLAATATAQPAYVTQTAIAYGAEIQLSQTA